MPSFRTRPSRGVALLLLLLALVVLLGVWLLREEWGGALAERIAKEQKIKPSDLAKTWGWRFACLDGVLLLGLSATAFLWAKPDRTFLRRKSALPGMRSFWIGLILVFLFAGALRLPRMNLSLYNDEAYAFRRHIAGSFRSDMTFRQAPWSETLWRSEMGNNGSLFSVTARVGYDLWKGNADAADGEVKEWPLRLPSLLGGLLSILLAALIARSLAGNSAGLLAAGVAAIHPWHLRYSTEARPHGLAMGLAALVVWTLLQAIRSGRWSWWLGFAAAEVLLLGTYLGAVPLLIVVNLAALVWILVSPERRLLLGRLIVSNLLAAMLWLPAFFSLLPQATEAIATYPSMGGGPVPRWWGEAAAGSLIGVHGWNHAPANPVNPALLGPGSHLVGRILLWLGAFAALLASALGLRELLRTRRPEGGFLLAILLLTPLLAWGLAISRDAILHPWYAVVALPFVAVAMGVGLARRSLRTGLALSLLFVAAAAPVVMTYLAHPKQQLREMVATARGGVYPEFGSSKQEPSPVRLAGFWCDSVYDPKMPMLGSVDDLKTQIAAARETGETFLVVFGHETQARAEFPALVEAITDSAYFVEEDVFPGLVEDQFTHRLFRHVGNELQ